MYFLHSDTFTSDNNLISMLKVKYCCFGTQCVIICLAGHCSATFNVQLLSLIEKQLNSSTFLQMSLTTNRRPRDSLDHVAQNQTTVWRFLTMRRYISETVRDCLVYKSLIGNCMGFRSMHKWMTWNNI